MSEIKKSTLLAELKEKSLRIGKTEKPPFTAERFVIAAIDTVKNTSMEESSLELTSLRMKLCAFKDLSDARAALLSYVDERSIVFLDDIYMKKRYGEACSIAEKLGTDTVTAVHLLDVILKNPSEFIAPLLKTEEAPAPAEKAEAPAVVSSDGDVIVGGSLSDFGIPEPVAASPVVVKHEMSSMVEDVRRIRSELLESVHGQDNAVHIFSTGYFQACLLSKIDKKRNRPKATFLFAGPPGVGKTFLAEKAAEALKLPFMRFDMSEYADKEANLEFCGSDKVYKNSKAGNVTSFVAENPKCVLLFDEIEKAHLCVIHLFLQMLDAGRLRDNYTDREVSFTDAIIILTTNAGKQLYEESETGDFSSLSRKVIVRALQTDVNPATNVPYFPGALCSRFASGNVVMFNHIGAHDLRTIARKEICRQAKNLHTETGIRMEIDPKVYTALLFAEGSAADARTVRSRAESFFNNELYELLRLVASEKVSAQVDSIETVSVDVNLSRASAEIKALFAPEEPEKILVFASDETVDLCRRALPDLCVEGVRDKESAVAHLQRGCVEMILLDMGFGACSEDRCSLNIEDVNSPARDFFRFMREQGGGTPLFLIEDPSCKLSEEEKISFLRQGVRGTVSPFGDEFASRIREICDGLYQQESMVKLAKQNKVVSFETAQTISEDGKNATISLFDFVLSVAVDSEDAKNVMSSVSRPAVRFEDVIGGDDAKKELAYFVEYLRNPKKYMGTGVKAPKGILLYGPPGTGKTLLAKAMAGESDVTFLAAEGNQFLKRYVGEGPEAVHNLFKTARKYAPSILFIDEIDAIARVRGGDSGSADVSAATLTAFLTEMDGFVNDPSRPVFVLAATNYEVTQGTSRSLDPALLRRFDRTVCVDLPRREDRIRFLRKKFSSNPAFEISEAEIETLAMRSTGMSLANLDSAAELALRSAIRDGSTKVTDAIMEEAFETFNSGDEKKWDASLLERVARHEAGHAFLCWESGETPSYLTIVARGNHGGYMRHADQEGKAIHTKDELLARIRTSLGGRAAEIVCYGEKDGLASGASGDLRHATAVARRIVCSYGMDEAFGLAVVSSDASESGPMSLEVRGAVNRILNEQMSEAIRLIRENRKKLDLLVEALMLRNHLTGTEIEEILNNDKN